MPTSLDLLVRELGHGLEVVAVAASAENGPRSLLRSLGWDLPLGVDDIGLAAVDLSALAEKLDELEEELDAGTTGLALDAKFAQVVLEVGSALTHLRAAVAGISAAGDYVDKTQIKGELLPRLSSLLIVSSLAASAPFALVLLQFCGVVTVEEHDADPSIFQVEHARPVIHWDLLGQLFTDPLGLVESRYGWGTADFNGDSLVANLSALVELVGTPVRVRQLPRRVEEQLAGVPVPEADAKPATQLIASFLRGDEASGLDVGISLYPLRASAQGGTDGGLGVSPYVHGVSDLSFPLAEQVTVEFQTTFALDSGIAVQLRPGSRPSIKVGLLGPGGVVDGAAGRVLALLRFAAESGEKLTLLSSPGGGLVEADSVTIGGGVDVARGGVAPNFVARLAGGHAVISGNGGDSFLTSLVPGGGAEAHFDLGLRWSGSEGFSFEGSAQAGARPAGPPVDCRLPDRVSPRRTRRLARRAAARAERHRRRRARPAQRLRRSPRSGRDARLPRRQPRPASTSTSRSSRRPASGSRSTPASSPAAASSRIDPDRGEYAGALQLVFADFLSVSAIGLITTKMPDGSPGFSLLIIITAEFGAGHPARVRLHAARGRRACSASTARCSSSR